MNRRILAAIFDVILLLFMNQITDITYAAENVNETVIVEANATNGNQTSIVGNVTADEFGVYVGSEDGFSADVSTEIITVIKPEDAQAAYGLVVESIGDKSVSTVRTGDIMTGLEWGNQGLIIRTINNSHAGLTTGNVTGWMGIIAAAETASSIQMETGDVAGTQLGIQLNSLNGGQLDAKTGIITAEAEALSAGAENGGRIELTSAEITSEKSGALYGSSTGQNSSVTVYAGDLIGTSGAIRIMAENGGEYYVRAKELTVSDSGWEFLDRYGIDSLTSAGTSSIELNGGISLTETGAEGEGSPAGIRVRSEKGGSTGIYVLTNIHVNSEKTEAAAYGITAENAGGTVNVVVEKDVSVVSAGPSIGVNIINNSDEAIDTSIMPFDRYDDEVFPENYNSYLNKVTSINTSAIETHILIKGDLSGTTYGLSVQPEEKSLADVFIGGTLSGGTDAVLVSKDVSPENFVLTAWKIRLNHDGHAVVKEDGSAAENIEAAVRYIIKTTPGSQEKVFLTDKNGEKLQIINAYPAAAQGEWVYLHPAAGYFISAAYNNGEPLERDSEGRFYLIVPKGGGVMLSVESGQAADFHRFLNNDGKLPTTGFSSHSVSSTPLRSQGFAYDSTGLTLQIPSLDVMEPIVAVPITDGDYPVEWLGNNAGLLDSSALPGEGLSVIVGHNHLNTNEAGPFLFLGTLKSGDKILITDRSEKINIFRVYANVLIDADDFSGISEILAENALILVTCEDESPDGGYLHRRVILAEQTL